MRSKFFVLILFSTFNPLLLKSLISVRPKTRLGLQLSSKKNQKGFFSENDGPTIKVVEADLVLNYIEIGNVENV
jgi:hypothetical protein